MVAGIYNAVHTGGGRWRLVYLPITRHLCELIEEGDEAYIRTMALHHNRRLH